MANEKKKKKIILPIILGIIVIGGIAYGGNKYVYSLHHQYTDDAQVDGTISPVNARLAGYISKIMFEENQQVTAGDTLALIDDRDYQLKVEQAQAAYDNAVANVNAVRSNVVTSQVSITTAQSVVDAAKAKSWKATQDFTRYQNLLTDKSITQAQFDAAKADKDASDAQLKQAQQQLDVARAQTNAAGEQVAVAEAAVKARQADIDFAKLQLSYTAIVAPATGIASKKNIQLGQLVQAGQALFVVVTDSNNYVVANFKETQLEKMKTGQKVTVTIDAFPHEDLIGEVYSFSGATGARFSLLPPDNASGNFVKVVQRVPVKMKVSVPDDLKSKLLPGMSARVEVDTD